MYFFYYVPVGIDAETRRFPLMTVFFAAVNIGVFVLQKYFQGALGFNFYNFIYYPGISTPVAALAAGFLHFGYLHIIGNLVYLVLFGCYLEDRLGPIWFALLYAGATMFGNVVQGYYNILVLGHNAGIIGASGAVSGVLGAFLIFLYRSRVRIAWWVFAPLLAYTRAGRSEIPVVFALALWVILQVSRSMLQFEGVSGNVAHMTHLAGFLFGIGLALLAGGRKKGREEAHRTKARRYLRKGDFWGACDELTHYAALRPDDGEAHAGLARIRVQTQDELGARAEYMRASECLLHVGQRGRAEEVYQEAIRSYPDFTLSMEPQLNMAFGLERNLKLETALRAYENFTRQYYHHAEAPFALLRAANLYRQTIGDSGQARACYERLIDQYPGDTWVDFAREQVRLLS